MFNGLRRLGQSLDLQPLCGLEEGRELILRHVHLPGVHELQDGREVLEGHVLEDDDGVLGGVLLEQGLEVGGAGREDHLVRLAGLAVAGQGHVREGLFVAEVLEGGDHVGLEVVPSQAKLLLVTLSHFEVLFGFVQMRGG